MWKRTLLPVSVREKAEGGGGQGEKHCLAEKQEGTSINDFPVPIAF